MAIDRSATNGRPTAAVVSTGCISNLLDGAGYERILTEAGYQMESDISRADLVLLNTCAFNSAKEEEALSVINDYKKRMRPGGRLTICGCLPDISRQKLQAAHDGLFFGPRDPSKLLELLPEKPNLPVVQTGPIPYDQYSALKKTIYQTRRLLDSVPILWRVPLIRRLMTPLFLYSKDVCCIRVATGCLGACTYCAIRFAKGRCVSRPFNGILDDVRRSVEQGFKKILLVGDEITAYGHDLTKGLNILDVIETIVDDPQVDTLYLESFEPSFMIAHFDRLYPSLERGKTPVFCSSVQSGSNRILDAMRRRYRAEDYLRYMLYLKRNLPWIYLRNEFIVGFPGETEEDFATSLQLVRDLNADFTDAYEYDDRPNTAASRMPNKVPAEKAYEWTAVELRIGSGPIDYPL
jgi:threonylcarbamoyladenosine tRNA methylthiotransferase MtaB